MPAASPLLGADEPISILLNVEGSVFDTEQIVAIEIWHAANRIPRARIVLSGGGPDAGGVSFDGAGALVPGAKVEIAAGYGPASTSLFSGVVISHSIAINSATPARLTLDCSDELLRMTLSRSSKIWEDVSDAGLVSALIAASGGSVGRNAVATTVHPGFFQAHASDWDVMLMRAGSNGCVVLVDDGQVDIVLPSEASAPVLRLDYGESIISLDLSIAAPEQLAGTAIATSMWNYANQEKTTVAAASPNVVIPGNLSSAMLANVFGVSTAAQTTGASMSEPLLSDWADGALIRRQVAQVRGTVKFQGSGLSKPGTFVTLGNLGARFDGDVWVGAVNHLLSEGNWQTTVELGLPPQTFASREPNVADASAAGLLPPLRGLQTGKVTKIADDPDGESRVQVRLPMFDADHTIWARLASFYASSGFGAVFLPEIDDEVLLGFMNEDPTNPIILGSVYSSQRPPSLTPGAKNATKAIVTRSKMAIQFDDEDMTLKISTPGGRVVTLDDTTGTISIKDPDGHHISLTNGSVDIVSRANLAIASQGDMSIECGGNLTISAKALGLSAAGVSVHAESELKLAADANASLKASAVLEINGALVKIN